MDGKLVCPHLVIATNDFLRALNEFVLEDIKTLLELVKARVDFTLFCCKLGILVDL